MRHTYGRSWYACQKVPPCREVQDAFARCLLTARWPVDRWLRALNVRGARSRRPRDLPNLLSLACLNQLCPTAAARPRRRPWLHAPAAPLRMLLLPDPATHLPLAACVATSPSQREMPDTSTPWQVFGCNCVRGRPSSAWRSKSRRLRAPPAPTSWTWRSSISWTSPSTAVRSPACSLPQHVMPARPPPTCAPADRVLNAPYAASQAPRVGSIAPVNWATPTQARLLHDRSHDGARACR